MNKIIKRSLAIGGGVVALEGLRRFLTFTPNPRYEPWERPPYREFENRVLVLGGGFAGYNAAKKITQLSKDRGDVGVMVISKENYFTFWPMLAGVISSDIQTQNVAQPLRRALIEEGASFRRATVEEIDLENQTVTAVGEEDEVIEVPYDHLIMALGGEPAYFGIPGVEEHAISMTSINTAEEIRNRVIERFEETVLARGDVPRSKLTFVIIGGGATGVETASELHGLIHDTLAPDYPNIDPYHVRIVLVDRNEQILKELDPALRRTARRKLADLRIEVINRVKAKEITADKVILDDGQEIECENVVWTAGARASVKLEDFEELPSEERTGLDVDEYCRVKGFDNVWGIGDCAANIDGEGNSIPPNAQAAVQGGHAVAKNVMAAIDGRELKEFKYSSLGQLVEMGSQFAVNEVMGVKFSGFLAALFWRATYLFKTESPQNKARIAADWVLELFFHPTVTQIRGRD
ncbi:MAG: NAD(P)/FAD-dependent oxidoreductase [Rubrobacteraceae bacterium]